MASAFGAANCYSYSFLNGFYTSFRGGFSYTQSMKDRDTSSKRTLEIFSTPSYNYGASFGYKADQFRSEVAFNYSRIFLEELESTRNTLPTVKGTNTKKGRVLDFMLNGYYDMVLDGPATLFFGGGIGYAKAKINYKTSQAQIKDFSKDNNLFAYNLMAGIKLNINYMFNVMIEYRYFGTTNATIGKTVVGNQKHEDPVKIHSLNLGLLIKLT